MNKIDKLKFYRQACVEQLFELHQRVKDGEKSPNQTANDIMKIANQLKKLNDSKHPLKN